MMEPQRRVNFCLSVSLLHAFVRACETLELSKSALLRIAIRDLLQAEGFIAGPAPPPTLPARKRVVRQKERAEPELRPG
jgi:hypothetical protein